jgi:hypothetical protein
LDRLFAALWPGGVLGIMTGFVPPTEAGLESWHYIRDPTHVCFWGREVFEYIASMRQSSVLFPARNVALLIASDAESHNGLDSGW